jgi:hypothetical protein
MSPVIGKDYTNYINHSFEALGRDIFWIGPYTNPTQKVHNLHTFWVLGLPFLPIVPLVSILMYYKKIGS